MTVCENGAGFILDRAWLNRMWLNSMWLVLVGRLFNERAIVYSSLVSFFFSLQPPEREVEGNFLP